MKVTLQSLYNIKLSILVYKPSLLKETPSKTDVSFKPKLPVPVNT